MLLLNWPMRLCDTSRCCREGSWYNLQNTYILLNKQVCVGVLYLIQCHYLLFVYVSYRGLGRLKGSGQMSCRTVQETVILVENNSHLIKFNNLCLGLFHSQKIRKVL